MLTSPEVAREAALRAIGAAVTHEASNYRRWIADGAQGVDPFEATDVNSECAHERLPHDPCPSPDGVWPYPHPCVCWGEARAPTPDLMSTFNQETAMPEATAAPLGYLADGVTPRRRRAARKARIKLASPPARGTSKALPQSMLTQVIAELDAEIVRLTTARDALKGLIA